MERRTHPRLTTEDLAGRRRPDLWEPGVPPPHYEAGYGYEGPGRPEPAAPPRRVEVAPAPRRPEPNPFFPSEERERLTALWQQVQEAFVDDPQAALARADGLVARVMQRLAQVFSDERTRLEADWSRRAELTTEDLRQSLQRYRAFFSRLLSV